MGLPAALHVLTYDMRGTVAATGLAKPARLTGLVEHTHQLVETLAASYPETRWAITQTGAADTSAYQLRLPDGTLVLAQGIDTAFARYLAHPQGGKDPAAVRHFYEDTIDVPDNPIYAALAAQYAHVISAAGMPDLVAQNINPLIGVLKAEEFGRLDAVGMGQLRVTGVIHDLADAPARFDYLRRRLDRTHLSVRLVAVSSAVAQRLTQVGIPARLVTTVPNGLDTGAFLARVAVAAGQDAYRLVAQRNGLPATGTTVLMSARRVAWKGHLDLIAALGLLVALGLDADVHVVINGAGMHDTRALDYTRELEAAIARHRLGGRVFLLDDLSPVEVAACYRAADIAVLPSRTPEAFGYANIEAMLAGAAVITTNHGGPLDYITDGESGLLVPPQDPPALAAALQRLLTDPGLRARIARAGHHSARRFSCQVMARGYAEVLSSHDRSLV